MRLLYIQASPRTMRSHCKAIAEAFVEAWSRFNTGSKVDVHNIWEMELPDFDGAAVEGRYLAGAGKECSGEQRLAWGKVAGFAENFISYDRYVIASPMWNYLMPYRMKHYLDLVIQPGISFMRSDEEYKSAAAQKKTALFLARAGEYPEGSPLDFQKPYFEQSFKMMGLKNNYYIMVEPTGADAQAVKSMHTAKINEALALAKEF